MEAVQAYQATKHFEMIVTGAAPGHHAPHVTSAVFFKCHKIAGQTVSLE